MMTKINFFGKEKGKNKSKFRYGSATADQEEANLDVENSFSGRHGQTLILNIEGKPNSRLGIESTAQVAEIRGISRIE